MKDLIKEVTATAKAVNKKIPGAHGDEVYTLSKSLEHIVESLHTLHIMSGRKKINED